MKISYGITTWIEHEELNNLLNYLNTKIDDEDEIIVVYDKNRATIEVLDVLNNFKRTNYKAYPFNFQQNWLENKNYLGSKCTGEYIFQIDADELPPEFLLENIKPILETNPEIDVYWVPRINIVKQLTPEHIKQWGWNINEKGWVNFPDPQKRIYRNSPEIQWRDPEGQPQVHGMVTGYKTIAQLPFEEEFSLIHTKTISKQEYQNKTYNDVLTGKGRED
jgi:hypothetical protein